MKYYIDPKESNPFPKFDHQISALESMGFDVYYLGIKHEHIYLCHKNKKEFIYELYQSKLPGASSLIIYDTLYKATRKIFRENTFDLAYIRAMPTVPSYAKALKLIKKSNTKIVIEIPTYPFDKEVDEEKRLFRKLYFKLSNRYFIKTSKYVDLFVLIGDYSDKFADKPAINIENGIFINNIPIRSIKHNYREIHLLGLANMAKWHGYDRVIEGLRQYKKNGGNKKVVLHLVGPDGDGSLDEWRILTKKYKLEDNVIFEGPKFDKELDWYLDNCQIAIGSIGIHRINFNSTSALKLRDYMARGIPFIMSATNQEVKFNKKFCITVPADDSPIDIDAIIDYVEDITEWEELSKSMRKYANKNMTWEKQFAKIFEEI